MKPSLASILNSELPLSLSIFGVLSVSAHLISYLSSIELRWVNYLCLLALFCFALLGHRNFRNFTNNNCVVSVGFLAFIIFYSLLNLYPKTKNLGFNGLLQDDVIVAIAVFLGCLGILNFPYKVQKIFKIEFLLSVFISSFFTLIILQFRVFDVMSNSFLDVILASFLCATLWVYSRAKIFFTLIWVSSFFYFALLAFRSDWFLVDLYHPSYFIDVISTLKDGGELYKSAVSQYGLIFFQIATWIPGSALYSFHILQSSLLVSALIISGLCLRLMRANLLFVVSICALVVLADPYLIGPNPYPSSSVARFFPVYIWLVLIVCTPIVDARWWRLGSLALSVFSGLWSAENLVYSLAVVFTWELLQGRRAGLSFWKIFLRVMSSGCLVIGATIACLSGLTGNSWVLHFMYAFGYAEGLGGLQIAEYACVFFFASIWLTSLLTSHDEEYDDAFVVKALCVGLAFGLFSYYYGRAVPHNITAMAPILGIISLVVWQKEQKCKSLTALPLALFTVMGAFNLTQSLAKIPSAGTNSIEHAYNEYREIGFSASEDIDSITFVSNARFHFDLPPGTRTALPSPPMLLMEPLPRDMAKQVISEKLSISGTSIIVFEDQKQLDGFARVAEILRELDRCSEIIDPTAATIFTCKF